MTRRLVFLGGAGFLGRALWQAAKKAGYDVGRRHREGIPDEAGAIDLCVDFGARSAADVREVLANARDRIGHYVLVSSYEVYPAGHRLRPWTENGIDLTDAPGMEDVDGRAARLRAAERELWLTGRRAIPWTVLRPSVIEGVRDPTGHTRWFVERLLARRPILLPCGDLPFYRQVRGGDLVQAVLAVAGSEEAFFQHLNVTGAGLVTFETYARQLAHALGLQATIQRVEESEIARIERVPFAHGIERAFIAASSRLAAFGWTPTPPGQWVPRLARKLVETLPKPAQIEETPALVQRRLPAPAKSTADSTLYPSGWEIVGVPAQAGSLRLALTAAAARDAAREPLVRTRRVCLLGLDEWLVRRGAPQTPVVAGHHAVVEIVDPGESALRAGDTVLPHWPGDGREPGIHRDGAARDVWRAEDVELVPIPSVLSAAQALLALPLARMQLRLEKVLRAKDVVWVFGHRIEAVLGAWLATDAGCQVVHVDSVKVSAGQRSTTPLEEAQRAVELGQAAEPRVAVNISGSPNGERLLLKALPVNGVLVTPFDAGPHALARERVPMPWAPNAGELQRAIQLLAAWSVHRDLNACLASPVPPSRFQEALLAVPFKLPSIGCREERP